MATEQPQAQWKFAPEGSDAEQQSAQPADSKAVTWTASEYIHHQKGVGWYAAVGLFAAGASMLVYLLTKDMIATVTIPVAALLFAVSGKIRPRVRTYTLDGRGLHIGSALHPYSSFKSFSFVQEGALTNITFMPLKRFMPQTTIYFAPEDQQKIFEVLSSHLPYQEDNGTAIDRLMHRIRF